MTLSRRSFGGAVWVAGSLLAACAGLGPFEDRDYERLVSPQPVAGGAGIEVIEFFWYGCPHCADMHPRLQAWAQRLPGDVALRLEPVALSDKWLPGSRLHFALADLGVAERLAGAVFEAVQLDGLDLADAAAVADWAVRQGLDRQRFVDALQSPWTQQRAARSRGLGAQYGLRGVPSFVVDGRYLTSNAFTGSSPETLAVVDALVQRVREARPR